MSMPLSAFSRPAVLVLTLGAACCAPAAEEGVSESEGSGDWPGCEPGRYLELEDWMAVRDEMPGSRSAYVQVTVVTRSAGHEVSLRKAPRQDGDPTLLVLELGVAPPEGMSAQVITEVSARWDEEPPAATYERVQVRCGDEVVTELTFEVVH